MLFACAYRPVVPYSTRLAPLTFGPDSALALADDRGRFRQIFCAINEDHGATLPDPMPCDSVLAQVEFEPPPAEKTVELGQSRHAFLTLLVPGLGFDCVKNWLDMERTAIEHVASYGFETGVLKVNGLASSETNARLIADQILALSADAPDRPLVLVGYSKGAPDILEALIRYPDVAERIKAVIAFAGAVGGSPLADEANPEHLKFLSWVPGAECDSSDSGAIESLTTRKRRAWLQEHTLPPEVRYYSVVSFPEPERISRVLRTSYRKLAELEDARNDSQLLFYDQVIPGSTVLAFVNADHWAMSIPIARQHRVTEALFATENELPREVMLEALLRYLEEDLFDD